MIFYHYWTQNNIYKEWANIQMKGSEYIYIFKQNDKDKMNFIPERVLSRVMEL